MKSLQLDRPHAIIVIGIQGSGKTFFAQKFSEAFKAPFIQQALFTEGAADETWAEQLMQVVTEEMLKTGRSVVIELSLASRAERTELVKLVKNSGYTPLFVWVQVDKETAYVRAQRASKISVAEWNERSKRFTPPHAVERALVISGKHTFATQAKAVLKKLSLPRAQQAAPTPVRPTPQRGQIIVR